MIAKFEGRIMKEEPGKLWVLWSNGEYGVYTFEPGKKMTWVVEKIVDQAAMARL